MKDLWHLRLVAARGGNGTGGCHQLGSVGTHQMARLFPYPKQMTFAKESKGNNIWQWFGKEKENTQQFFF